MQAGNSWGVPKVGGQGVTFPNPSGIRSALRKAPPHPPPSHCSPPQVKKIKMDLQKAATIPVSQISTLAGGSEG